MNLLEINTAKLLEVLGSDAERGLSDEEVEKNRLEFSKTKRSTFAGDFFGDLLPSLFVLLSLFAFIFKKDAGALLTLSLFLILYLAFKGAVSRYSRGVREKISEVMAKAKVIREGEIREVDFQELVQGDIILLSYGDVVPCDALIIEQSTLRVNEIQLTGNSKAVLKLAQEDVVRGKGVPYYECILFAGSVVVSGWAKAVVCNIGEDVFDKKNKLTTRSKRGSYTRLFEISSFLSKNIALMWIVFTLLFFVTASVKGVDVFDGFYLAVTLSVLSLPDIIMTLFDLTLALASSRLYKKGCAVRDMTAIDRMCDVSCVAVDNSKYFRTSFPRPVTVVVGGEKKKFRATHDEDVRALFELALSACVSGDGGMSYNGVSVEKSLLLAGEDVGISEEMIREKYLILEKKPYDEVTRSSRVIYFRDGEFYTVLLGSPTAVVNTCYFEMKNGEKTPLLQRDKNALLDLAHAIAESGEGVVAIAIKKIEYKEGADQISSSRGYTFMGYIGLHTSIKADSARAVSVLKKSSVDVVLMTAEPKFTSIGFAKSLSILGEGDKVITANGFSEIDEGAFRSDIKDYKVYVSLSAENKRNIVSWRKAEGDIVASMVSTTDDLEVLLESDVAFSSTDSPSAVAQNSDVVLKGGFELIPECIKYARLIYRSVRHAIEYVMSFQFLLLFATLLPFIFMGKLIFTPPAVVLLTLFTVVPISASLASEKVRGNELKGSFGRENQGMNIYNLGIIPAVTSLVSAVVATLSAKGGGDSASLLFITLVSSLVFTALATAQDDTFDVLALKNVALILSSFFALTLSALAVFTPLSKVLGFTTPTLFQATVAFLLGIVPALVNIGVKLIHKYITDKNFKIKENKLWKA